MQDIDYLHRILFDVFYLQLYNQDVLNNYSIEFPNDFPDKIYHHQLLQHSHQDILALYSNIFYAASDHHTT